MRDRTPTNAGRVQLVPVAGQTNTYDMTMADGATEQGTPLNKATFLKDATAALYGLPNTSVPDDVFAWLGKYAEHCWRKSPLIPSLQKISEWTYVTPYAYSQVVSYSDSVSVGTGGEIILDNPQQITVEATTAGATALVSLAPCYITNIYGNPSAVYYLPQGITSGGTSDYGVVISNSQISFSANPTIRAETVTGFVSDKENAELVFSTNRNAYPDSGVSGGYEYEYLGVPFEKLPTAPKIETGSYVGTGTYGENNPNSITFSFVPKVVFALGIGYDGEFIQGYMGSYNLNGKFTMMPEMTPEEYSTNGVFHLGSNYTSRGKVSADKKTLYWYNMGTASEQLNADSYEYYFLAIG